VTGVLKAMTGVSLMNQLKRRMIVGPPLLVILVV